MGWRLVRDNQEQWAREHGVSGRWRTSADPVRSLARKLVEESVEYAESLDPGELGDVLDVLNALLLIFEPAQLQPFIDQWAAKRKLLGHFDKQVEWNPVPEEHEAEALS